jgi:hypothetical protein
VKKNVMITIFAFVFISFSVASVFANAKLLTQHKAVTNGAKKITTCNDCHNPTTKIDKKKGANYKPVLKTKSCAGKGCHK